MEFLYMSTAKMRHEELVREAEEIHRAKLAMLTKPKKPSRLRLLVAEMLIDWGMRLKSTAQVQPFYVSPQPARRG